MQKPEAQARENNVQHLQSAQLDRVSRVCISTIQRLYSMLRSFFFWIETLMPQGQFTRVECVAFNAGVIGSDTK